jgi:hypothetical protein
VKVIERTILPFQNENFFFPIRDKIDYIRVLMHSTRMLLMENEQQGLRCGYFKLIIDKMNRLFFYSNDKYFSISFPFNVLLDDKKKNCIKTIETYSRKEIDFQTISGVFAVLNDTQFLQKHSLIDYYIIPNSLDEDGISILEEILQFEPAYVRYDFDKEHENGKFHPLHHLDINYSTYGTFKLGLNNAINEIYFENLHNINTECQYIK